MHKIVKDIIEFNPKNFIINNRKAIITGGVCFAAGMWFELGCIATNKRWKNSGITTDSFRNTETGQVIYTACVSPTARELFCNGGKAIDNSDYPYTFVADSMEELNKEVNKYWRK